MIVPPKNVISESIVRKIVENVLNEWRPKQGYDEWANLETGGAHGRGIQHRKNFTRKENAKGEKVSELKTVTDFIRVIRQLGLNSEENAQKIFKLLVRRYKQGVLILNDLNKIGQFGDFEGSEISNMILDYVQTEGEQSGYLSKFGKKIVDNPTQKLQPK